MANRCATPECRTDYESIHQNQLGSFLFPLKNIELNKQWVKNWNLQKTWSCVSCTLKIK